ncbi:hypothetical protein JCM1840_002211 [Sporobolomyces johnsonii]
MTYPDSEDLKEKSPTESIDHGTLAVPDIDPAVERQVIRKLDCTVLVMFTLIFGLNYLDKIGLSYAAIFGMKTDLHLVGQDYSWCSSIFYFGQFLFEYPAIWLLHKFPIRTFVAVTIVIWSIVVGCHAAANDFAGMMAVRFFLGIAEGAVAPAFVLLVSFFYRKAEQPIRIAVFVSANAIAQICGALLLYGCGSIKNGAIEGFRISYLICAAMTIVAGVGFLLLVPSSPATAWFLNAEEREVAVHRVASERAAIWRTLRDVKFYLVFLWAFLLNGSSVISFGSIVINGLGFTPLKTILVGLPGPALQLATIWIGAGALWLWPNSRAWTQMSLTLVPLAGVVMMKALPFSHKWALTGGYWLATCGSSVYVVNMSLIASNFKGHTRKTMFSTVYFMGYCAGCICGPQLFLAREAPLYKTAMATIIAWLIIYLLTMLAFRQLCARENNRRDRLAADGVEEAKPRLASEEDNRTDIEDLAFRYVL